MERDYILIVGSFNDDGKSKSVGDAISIPWGMVEEVEVLDSPWSVDAPLVKKED
jgi:hypothetical protein